jgi:hypothetical protein
MNKYSKKQCVEEFLFSIGRAITFAKKVPGKNVPKEIEKYEPMLREIVKELGELEEKLFRAQWDKEDEEAAE